jgi:hypothetical protein
LYRRYIEILKLISRELLKEGKTLAEAAAKFEREDINLLRINEELTAIERFHLLSDEEADAIRSILVFLIMKKAELDAEDAYAIVFGNGRRLIWH